MLMNAATEEDPARVIIVSSVGGIVVPHVGQTGAIAYSASKAAAHHLGRNFAMELVPHNITTNVIGPGWFRTRLAGPAIDKAGGDEVAGLSNPMGRLGVPEDIAGCVVYLCSRAGRYVNGQDISVDGGSHLMNASAASHIAEVRKKKGSKL
jgi:NAD(P)-dependent dehydrogenase (short-subunit alcohol dehydrogenase family)